MAATLVGLLAIARTSAGQELLADSLVLPAVATAEPAPVGSLVVDPQVQPASLDYSQELDYEPVATWQNMSINWISGPYFKSGVNFVLGEGLLDTDLSPGYTISGGYRQPLGADRAFVDLGGSYMSAFGETTRNTAGRQTLGNIVTTINNAFSTTLDEVQRAGMHAALGWYWGDPLDNRAADPQFRLATRVGGRLAHVRGRFADVRLVNPPVGATLDTTYLKTDTVGGIFVGMEAILLHRKYTYGQVQWSLDGEFANDWVEFGGFESSNLATASLMLGFMFSR